MLSQSLSVEQLRRCDANAVAKLGIPSIILMENAGIDAFNVALCMIRQEETASVVVLAGHGNNGGDGLVLARHMCNNGIKVDIFTLSPFDKFKGDARTNLDICRNMGLAITEYKESLAVSFINKLEKKLRHADLVVDAMLGTGVAGELREPYGQIIDLVNSEVRTILAIDIPSGLDADTGKPTGSDAIRANCTVTFAALKKGYDYEYAVEYTGDIILGGIGISPYFLLDDLKSIIGEEGASAAGESPA